MQLEDMTEGRRVRIRREIELFPLGRFPAGLWGMVQNVSERPGETLVHVRLDEHFESLREWGNCLVVGGSSCSPDDFEPATAAGGE